MTKLADYLKKARTRAGLSLRRAGRRIGVSHQAVFLWENGDTQPTLGNVGGICEAYAISPYRLLKVAQERGKRY